MCCLCFTALITLLMAAANLFKQDDTLRGIQELCLLLIWISGLLIAVGTAARQIPAERENRTIFSVAGQARDKGASGGGEIPWLLVGVRRGVGDVLRFFCDNERFPRTRMAADAIFFVSLDAVDFSGNCDRDGLVGVNYFCGTIFKRNDNCSRSGGNFVVGKVLGASWFEHGRTFGAAGICSLFRYPTP